MLSGGFFPTFALVTNKLLKFISIVILVKRGLLFILKHSVLQGTDEKSTVENPAVSDSDLHHQLAAAALC